MKTHYSDDKPAGPDAEIYLSDVKQVVSAARRILVKFGEDGTDQGSDDDTEFNAFIVLLYCTGMVMSGFDAPLFDKGPGRLIADRESAAVMMGRANLLTIRMFLHTLARGHRATWVGYGYPYFAEAYKSGGLKALIDRLQLFCEIAERNGSATLCDASNPEESSQENDSQITFTKSPRIK